MRRKVKTAASRLPLRKSAMSAGPAARRAFPAWIDADERLVSFPAVIVTPRVRDGLVLRSVPTRKLGAAKGLDAPGGR